MKNLLLSLPIVLLASCAATKTAPIPDATMATRSGTKVATLQQDHAVYLAHCGRCHEHILPKDVSKVVFPNDFDWSAKNRDRILAEWQKRYQK